MKKIFNLLIIGALMVMSIVSYGLFCPEKIHITPAAKPGKLPTIKNPDGALWLYAVINSPFPKPSPTILYFNTVNIGVTESSTPGLVMCSYATRESKVYEALAYLTTYPSTYYVRQIKDNRWYKPHDPWRYTYNCGVNYSGGSTFNNKECAFTLKSYIKVD